MQEANNNRAVGLSSESLNSLELILEESWRLSKVLQLKERVEIRMVETSEYLCKDVFI